MMPLPVKTFVALSQALQFTVGVPWEYIRLRNESDNECSITFSGAGNATLAAWVQDDFYVGKQFTGQISVTPIATTTTTTLQAGFVTGNAYAMGELKNPGSIMLVRIVAVTPITSQFLSNEGNALGTTVIDIGTPTIANLWQIFNDHFVIYVQQGGVRHQVLAGQIAPGNPLLIGNAGDIAEFAGNATVDQALVVNGNTTLNALTKVAANFQVTGTSSLDNGLITTDGSGDITIPNNQAYQAKNTAGTAKAILLVAPTTDIVNLQGVTTTAGQQIQFRNGSLVLIGAFDNIGTFYFGQTGGTTSLKRAGDNASLLDFTTLDTYLKAINGKMNFQGDGSHTDWGRSAESHGTGTSANGTVAITHNLQQHGAAATPDQVIITPTASPTLFWITAIGSATFTINATSAFAFSWYCVKF